MSYRHMAAIVSFYVSLAIPAISLPGLAAASTLDQATPQDKTACEAMLRIPNLTILGAELRAAEGGSGLYCYVKGSIEPGIRYHVQLPLPQSWNGRLLNIG